jgi:O-antigen/teichoic acid export membrane protein
MLSKRELVWGYGAQGLSIGFGLIILPVIVRHLPPAEVGLWFVFLTLAGLAQLLETGFQPTLARNVAYVYAGARGLSATGLQEPRPGASLNHALLADLMAASRRVYRGIAIVSTLLLLVTGTFYIRSLVPVGHDLRNTLLAWVCFAVGNILNFYFGYLNALLQGRGDVNQANQVIVVSRLVQLVVGVGLVSAGLGLLGLGAATLLSAIASRLLAHRFARRGRASTQPSPTETKYSGNSSQIVQVLWHQASRYSLVLVGVFLIWRANILVASTTLGLEDAASYGLAIQIFILLHALASVPFNLSLPKLSSMRAREDEAGARRLFSAALASTLMLYTLFALVALALGNPILSLLGSQVHLPQAPIFGAMVIVFLLELNHGTCANYILTGNHIPFVAATLLTGTGIVLTSVALAPHLGVAAFVCCQGVWQLAYNNWKWPHEVSKLTQTPFHRLLVEGVRALRPSARTAGRNE